MNNEIKRNLDFCISNIKINKYDLKDVLEHEKGRLKLIEIKNGEIKSDYKDIKYNKRYKWVLIRYKKWLSYFDIIVKNNKHLNFCFLLYIFDKGESINIPLLKTSIRYNNEIPIPIWNIQGCFDKIKEVKEYKIEKVNKIIFAGRPTGSKKPNFNERIDFCNWSFTKPEIDSYISGITNNWKYSDVKHLYKKIEIKDQLEYKYLLNINGSVSSWDRFVWQMASDSVCMYLKPKTYWKEWYFPLFENKKMEDLPFVWVTKENILEVKKRLDEDNDLYNKIVENGNKFVDDYINEEAMNYYTLKIFEKLNNNYS